MQNVGDLGGGGVVCGQGSGEASQVSKICVLLWGFRIGLRFSVLRRFS